MSGQVSSVSRHRGRGRDPVCGAALSPGERGLLLRAVFGAPQGWGPHGWGAWGAEPLLRVPLPSPTAGILNAAGEKLWELNSKRPAPCPPPPSADYPVWGSGGGQEDEGGWRPSRQRSGCRAPASGPRPPHPARPRAHSVNPSSGGKSGGTDPVQSPAQPHSGLGERLTGLGLLI